MILRLCLRLIHRKKVGVYPIPTEHCLDDSNTKLSALASYFANNKFPLDPSSQDSCFSGLTGDKAKMYFYKSDDGKFYILAARMELLASSNYDNKIIGLEGLAQNIMATYVGPGKTGKAADNAWYVAYGPKIGIVVKNLQSLGSVLGLLSLKVYLQYKKKAHSLCSCVGGACQLKK